jgi:hypothetical protein
MAKDQGRGPDHTKIAFEKYKKDRKDIYDLKEWEMPSRIQKATVDGHESIADRELRRLQQGDVFRSNPTTVTDDNSNPRRNR